MNKIKRYLPIIILGLFLGSCLKYGLDELPAFEDAEITKFSFEHRAWDYEKNELKVVKITSSNSIDTINLTIDCLLKVTNSNITKYGIDLDSLVGFAEISVASSIVPVGNAPILGIPGDFSQENIQYEVIGADDKTKKIWTINIEGL